MRQFFEEWAPYVNRQPTADDLELDGKGLCDTERAVGTEMLTDI